MEPKENIYKLACTLGVENKIDVYNEDPAYWSQWGSQLQKLQKLHQFKTPSLSLDDMGSARVYSADNYHVVAANITIDSHVPEPTASKIVAIPEEERFDSKKVKKTVFIVDVDHEYTPAGNRIMIYTRTVGSDETNLLVCEYDDYFYIQVDKEHTQPLIRKTLKGQEWYLREKRYPESKRRPNYFKNDCDIDTAQPLIKSIEYIDDHKSMYGYQPACGEFLKITTTYPSVTRDLFNGMSKKHPEMMFYEAKTDIINKFMTQYSLATGVVVDVEGITRRNTVTSCDNLIEVVGTLRLNSEVKEFFQPRMFYFDIEVVSDDINTFPTSDKCPVIQISYICAKGVSEVVDKGVLCYKETPGYESFETEQQMLIAFAQKIRQFKPDIVSGYNHMLFDWPYVIDRMKVLGIYGFASQFSKRNTYQVDYTRTTKSSKQFGTKEVVKCSIPGSVNLDQLEVIKGNAMIRLRSYALKSVCAEYLGDQNKEDLNYRDIPEFFKTAEGRKKIADYCMQDTTLLIELDKVFMFGIDNVGQAKVLGCTLTTVLERGVVAKVMCKMKQLTEKYKFLIPSFTEKQHPASPTYQGATVLNCDAGYYEDPVVVLDFASLYPSIQRSYNLDYTTIVRDPNLLKLYPDRFVELNGYHFAKKEFQNGLIPILQRELATQRKSAKKKMAEAPDGSAEQAVWNSIQGGVKILMNSVYGATGAPTAPVPAVELAGTVTYLGRYNLERGKNFVEENYCRITGETKPAKVIYGDTDSIFIKMPDVSVKTAIAHGQKLDKELKTNLFGDLECLVMEYEKIYCPYIQVTPKRYAGYKYEFDHTKAKVSASGLQLVKRDSALMCKRTMQAFFDHLLVEKDKGKALELVKKNISDLFANRMLLEDFELTKKISKKPGDYKTVPPHIAAWQRMVKRVGPTEAPCVGERFAYVIQNFNKKRQSMADAIVDTALVKEQGFDSFDLAKEHYFNLYIYNPMHVIMRLVYGDETTERVLNPKNYTHVQVVTAKKGNILSFFGAKSMKRTVGAIGYTGNYKRSKTI